MKEHATPHIDADPGDFAPVVLMPGDPIRANFLAKTYLEGARLVNNVRGVQGYTGSYRGCPVSVMASGMGMPSMAIYSHELYHMFGVEAIIRVGSAGGLRPEVKLRDLVFGMGASTDSALPDQFGLHGRLAPLCDYTLLRTAVGEAERLHIPYHVGNLLSSDIFYREDSEESLAFGRMGVLAVEMEAAALYTVAARAGRRALALCTVSDHLLTGEALSSDARATGFTDMMEVALGTALRLYGGAEQ